jgi:hypothetical protein
MIGYLIGFPFEAVFVRRSCRCRTSLCVAKLRGRRIKYLR